MKLMDLASDVVHGYEKAFKRYPIRCAFILGSVCSLGAYGLATLDPAMGGIALGAIVSMTFVAWMIGKPKL